MKISPLIVFSLLLTGAALGQVQERDSTETTFGIRFLFDGFRPSGGLGAKLWLSKNSAIAVNITAQTQKTNYLESSSIRQSISFLLDYELHFRPFFRNVSIFGVISPNIGAYHDKYESPSYPSDQKYFFFGLGIGWGVEYWLDHNLSLSANQTVNYRQELSSNVNRNVYSGYITTSSLMIALYF